MAALTVVLTAAMEEPLVAPLVEPVVPTAVMVGLLPAAEVAPVTTMEQRKEWNLVLVMNLNMNLDLDLNLDLDPVKRTSNRLGKQMKCKEYLEKKYRSIELSSRGWQF